MQGAMQIAQQVVAHDGIGGLYRGFGTVILGVIPARAVQCRMSLCRGVTVSAHTRAILPVMLHMAAQGVPDNIGSREELEPVICYARGTN